MKPNAFESHAAAISDLGFLLRRDLPTDGEDATLVLALRATPTLRHFDPELVTYWRADDRGRGHRGELSFETPMPLHVSFSWGMIEVVDRFGIANSFVTVGGTMDVRRVDARTVVGVLRSPGPILRRGGHSQSYDQFASELIAFFARMMVPIDFVDGAEGRISDADPAVRYAMFLQHELARLSASELVRSAYAIDARLVRAEARRLAARRPAAWAEGRGLLELLGLVREAKTALPASATG